MHVVRRVWEVEDEDEVVNIIWYFSYSSLSS